MKINVREKGLRRKVADYLEQVYWVSVVFTMICDLVFQRLLTTLVPRRQGEYT